MPSLTYANLDRVWILADFFKLSDAPAGGTVIFNAVLGPSDQLIDTVADQIVVNEQLTMTVNANTGHGEIQLPVTDDPDLSPSGWVYRVTEQISTGPGQFSGRAYTIAVPLATPVNAATGRKEINLADISPTDPNLVYPGYVLASTPLANGSVTPAKLAAGATTPDGTKAYFGDGTWKVPAAGTVADGSVTLAKLSFDPATQVELDAEAASRTGADATETAARLAAPTPLNVLLGTVWA